MNQLFNLAMLFFIAHFLGDYYCQNGTLATKKAKSYGYTLIHCFVYSVPFLIIWYFFLNKDRVLFYYIAIITLTHYPIDLFKCYLTRNQDYLVNRGYRFVGKFPLIYEFDQMLHILIIVVCLISAQQHLIGQYNYVLTNLNALLLVLIFAFTLGYQVFYVTIRIFTNKGNCISNWYELNDSSFKWLSCLICVMGILANIPMLWLFVGLATLQLVKLKYNNDYIIYAQWSVFLTLVNTLMEMLIRLFF